MMQGHVMEAIKTFFSGSKKVCESEESDSCQICLTGRRSLELGEEVVGVVLQTLLVPPEKGNNVNLKDTSLWLCGKCTLSLTTLTDLFLQLEELRCEFNEMGKRVGKQVILSSLGRSQEEWVRWEEEARGVEHIFPSCVGGKLEAVYLGTETKEDISKSVLEESVKTKEDIKLYKMTPVVLLDKLLVSVVNEIPETLSCEQEFDLKEEDFVLEFPGEGTEDTDIFSGDSVGSNEKMKENDNKEPLEIPPRMLRKRRIPFKNEIEGNQPKNGNLKASMNTSRKSSPISWDSPFRNTKRQYLTIVSSKDKIIEYECKTCKSKFKCRKMKYRCQESHEGAVKCRQCEKTFSRKDNLTRHMKIAHS